MGPRIRNHVRVPCSNGHVWGSASKYPYRRAPYEVLARLVVMFRALAFPNWPCWRTIACTVIRIRDPRITWRGGELQSGEARTPPSALLFHALGGGTAPKRPGAFPGHARSSLISGFASESVGLGAERSGVWVPVPRDWIEVWVGGAGYRGMTWGFRVGVGGGRLSVMI